MAIDFQEDAMEREAQKEQAKKELAEFGLENIEQNIEAVLEQQKTPQLPDGYDEVIDKLNSPEELKAAMESKGIKAIVHSEGKTVWDHAKLGLQQIGTMDISDEEKKDLRLIFLYHDLGKSDVWNSEQNIEATKKKLAKGDLQQSMIKHAEAGSDRIKAGLEANGISGSKLEMFLKVVRYHMETLIIEQDPKKTVKLFEGFGAGDTEREQAVRLLTDVLQIDANATQHIDLKDGKLQYSKNEKKLKLNFEAVWKKYEEGKQILQVEQGQQKKKEEEANFEKSVFGGKLSDYLIKDRGLKPGPDLGKATGLIKGLMAQNKDKTPEELRKMIDETML